MRRAQTRSLQKKAVYLIAALFFLLPIFDLSSSPEANGDSRIDLTELSLEDLLSIKVVSVSKKAEKLSETSAAAYVITSDDIRRSGARNIPELLRQVPGIQVARISTNEWAISARGFASEFSNKLLVLIDGRSIYTPLYSGVYWDTHDLPLEDIEQIEVIRGPGATIWGANAVNGVINIITRHTEETQGLMLIAGGGSEESGFSTVRFGGDLGEGITYRAYGKYFDREEFPSAANNGMWGNWQLGRSGFRVDRKLADGGSFMMSGEAYDGQNGQPVTLISLDPPGTVMQQTEEGLSGGSILTRWTRQTGERSSLHLQIYGDRSNILLFGARELRNTGDIDVNHNFSFGTRQQVSWGGGFRISADEISNSPDFIFDPDSRTDRLFSAFIQDNLAFADKRLRFTLGSKFEHNSYTGFEFQPSARVSWAVNSRGNLWCAASRAVRTPSRAENDFTSNFAVLPGSEQTGGMPVMLTLVGSTDLESEDLLSVELGYRNHPFDRFAFDIAVYYHDFKTIIGTTEGAPIIVADSNPAHIVLPNNLTNGPGSTVTGLETSCKWDPAAWWMLHLGYTYLKIKDAVDAVSSDEIDLNVYSQYPKHQMIASSRFDLPRRLELDLFASLVDDLGESGVPGYTKLDVRVGWKPVDHLELSAAVLDLLEESHLEFQPWAADAKEIRRRYYGKLTWVY